MEILDLNSNELNGNLQQEQYTTAQNQHDTQYQNYEYNENNSNLNFANNKGLQIKNSHYQLISESTNQYQLSSQPIFQSSKKQIIQQFTQQNTQNHKLHSAGILFTTMEKIISKILNKKFFNNLILYMIKNLQISLQKAKQTQIIQIFRPSQDDWKYKKLFNKKNPNQQQTTLKQFINHCAIIIQSNFKSYITHKRYSIVIKRVRYIQQKIKALIKGWKVRQILKSKKLTNMRNQIIQINQEINNHLNRQQINKKFNYLNKQLKINIQLFNQQYEILYRTGGWIFQRNINNVNIKNTIQNINIKNQNNLPKQVKTKRNREFKTQRTNQIKSNVMQQKNGLLEFQNLKSDQRPIKSAGTYAIDQNVQIINVQQQPKKKPKKKINKPVSQNAIVEPIKNQQQFKQQLKQVVNEKQKERPKKLVKKQKYDPRKAIQQQKKRKAVQKIIKKDQIQNISKIDTSPNINHQIKKNIIQNKSQKNQKIDINQKIQISQKYLKTQKISKKQKIEKIQTTQNDYKEQNQTEQFNQNKYIRPSMMSNISDKQKVYKKIQSKVDCWSKKKQNIKNAQKKYYTKFTENIVNTLQQNSIQNFKAYQQSQINRQNQYNQPDHQELKPEQIQNQHYLQKKKCSQQRYEKITKNMQKILEKLQQKKQDKKNIYRPIEQLIYTYQNQYLNRFQKIMPKLEILFFQRNQQSYSGVPIILTKSIFGESINQNLDQQSFRRLSMKLEKHYRNILQA